MIYAGSYFVIAIIYITFAIVLLFWLDSNKNRILFVFSFCAGYFYLIYGLYFSREILNYPYLLHTQIPALYLSYIFGHLYYRYVFESDYRLDFKGSLIFIVPLVRVVTLIPDFALPLSDKVALLEKSLDSRMPFDLVPYNFYWVIIYFVSYSCFNLYTFIKITVNRGSLGWQFIRFRDPVMIFLGWLFLHYISMALIPVFYLTGQINTMHFIFVLHFILIFVLYFFTLFLPYFIRLKVFIPSVGEKYSNDSRSSNLVNVDIEALAKDLDQLMSEEKLFLDHDLTLASISDKLNIKSVQLSSYLKEIKDTNYNQYLSNLRVQEAKHLLQDNVKVPVKRIGLTVGFGSESSFFEVFKRIENITPAQYRKQNKKTPN